jgi:hypothetical protein
MKISSTAISRHPDGIAACNHCRTKTLDSPGFFHIIAAASCQAAASSHTYQHFTSFSSRDQQVEADDEGHLEWLQAQMRPHRWSLVHHWDQEMQTPAQVGESVLRLASKARHRPTYAAFRGASRYRILAMKPCTEVLEVLASSAEQGLVHTKSWFTNR